MLKSTAMLKDRATPGSPLPGAVWINSHRSRAQCPSLQSRFEGTVIGTSFAVGSQRLPVCDYGRRQCFRALRILLNPEDAVGQRRQRLRVAPGVQKLQSAFADGNAGSGRQCGNWIGRDSSLGSGRRMRPIPADMAPGRAGVAVLSKAFYAVDYVNADPDVNPRSFSANGVPDEMVRHIVWLLFYEAMQVAKRGHSFFDDELKAPRSRLTGWNRVVPSDAPSPAVSMSEPTCTIVVCAQNPTGQSGTERHE